MKAVFLLCLIATCFSFQTNKQLNTLQGANFGNLFAQIKEQIKAGSPLSNIEGLLDDLEAAVHKEQAEHDEMLARNGASCDGEEVFRTGEIEEGKAALRRASNHLAACENSRDKAEVDLAQTIVDIADSKAALAVATAVRGEEHSLFTQRVGDHRNAMSVVKGALGILDDLVTEEGSLAQLSQHTALLLRTGVKINLAHHYAPVIALFAQMATSEFDMFLDSGAVGRIRTMLEQLYSNIEESLADFSDNEAAAQDSFNTLKAKLEMSISELQTNQQNLTDHLEEMAQCVLEEKLLVTKSTEKVTRNSKLLALTREMCAAFQAEWAAATESRDEELDLLATVRKMVQRRLEGLGAAVADVGGF